MEGGATLENGPSAVWLVEMASESAHEPVPILLRRTVVWIALETTRRKKRAAIRLVKWKKVSRKITYKYEDLNRAELELHVTSSSSKNEIYQYFLVSSDLKRSKNVLQS